MGCWQDLQVSSPEVINYLESKTGKKYDPETKAGREEYLEAVRQLKNETVEGLVKLHSDIGNNKFEKKPSITVIQPSENKPPNIAEPPKENVPEKEGEGIGITHADTEVLRKETHLPEYEKTPQTVEQWRKDADERIADGKMPALLNKMKRGEPIDEVEQIMMGKHIATLDAEVKGKPTNENIKALEDAIQLSDMAGGTIWGRSGRARQETFLPDDSLGTALIKEKDSLGVDELTESQIAQVVKENAELIKVKEELAKATSENERLQREAQAKSEVEKIKKSSKKASKKTHEDFVKERQSFKDELKAAKEKHEKWLKDNNIQKQGIGGFVLTTDMAKVIGKIVKSHAEETVLKFEDLVNKVFDDAKDILEGISKKDIVDVMAGVYKEKVPTRSELAAKLFDFRKEAELLKKLEQVRLGKEPVSDKKKNEKSRRISELENKIKEVRERNKDNTPVEKTDAERLAAKRKFIQKSIDEIQKDIKAGKFEKPLRLPPVRLDKKTQALQDKLITLETQQLIRRQKNEYEKSSKLSKLADTFWQVLGLRRFVNSAIDFSILFRQASPITMNITKYIPIVEGGKLKMNTAPKAIGNMFNVAFSPDKFKRFQYNIEKSEDGRLFTHFNGVFSNPTEVKMEKREEEFTNNLLARAHQKIEESDSEGLKKVADIANRAWFSERAAAGLLNSIRIQEFSKGEIGLRKRGITPENSPEQYKELVKWVMNSTGRGNLLKVLEDSHAGRIAANRTYFGARLMAAKINMLNPYYYAKMPHAVRVQALKDMAGYTSTLLLAGLALKAAGATISLDWDEPDFLQARFGDKVYDISGGSVAYLRTFLRFTNAIAKQVTNFGSKGANSYSKFAGSSIGKTLFVNKLSPNSAYIWHVAGALGFPLASKSSTYDESGHLKPFDPYEIVKIYPLYVDGTIQAYKEGGLGEAMTILIPDIFGIGTQQYNKQEGGSSGGGGGANSNEPPTYKSEYKAQTPPSYSGYR